MSLRIMLQSVGSAAAPKMVAYITNEMVKCTRPVFYQVIYSFYGNSCLLLTLNSSPAERRLFDFSAAGKSVGKLFHNRNRCLFSMSTENALLSLLRDGVLSRNRQ
jgi:hypothetical protein